MNDLFELRDKFGAAAAQGKLRAFRRLAAHPPKSPPEIRRAHDELLFHAAHPDSTAISRAANAALRLLTRTATNLKTDGAFDNSGIAGAAIRTTFSVDLLRWLCRRRFGPVAIDWENEESIAALDRLIPLICCPAEIDGVLSDRRGTRAWIRRAAQNHTSDVAWLLEQLDRLPLPPSWMDDWYESLALPISFRPAATSRTFARFPKRPMFCNPGGLAKRIDLPALLETKLPRPAHLRASARIALVDIARATLAARGRETDPVTYANPPDLALFQLERGIDVALIGMSSERRLPIESYVGFVAARNRVPIAYGGSWIFGQRCEIGVNLFEEFRGGESAQIFGQVMRTYRQWFNVTQFLVDPFQFGADNEEAIRSGAFWFYYRLGFRSIEPAIRAGAEREARRLQTNPGARTSDRLLRRFATAKVFLDAPIGATPARSFVPVAPNLETLGLAVTDWIADRYRGDRAAAKASAAKWFERGASAHLTRAITAARPSTIANSVLAPLFAMLDSRRRFAARQWPLVYDVLRAKGSTTEREYVRAWQAALPHFSRQFAAF